MTIERCDTRPAGAPCAQEDGGHWLCARAPGGALLAALHLQAALGHSRARDSFHLGRVVHAAPELGLHQVQTTLQLGHDATGEAELSGLYLAPELDPDAAAPVLDALLHEALAQLQGQARSAHHPAEWVLVELPGWRDAQGRSPFWDGLVRHFLPSPPPEPAQLAERFGPALSTHLGAMLPRQLIHAAFLAPAAQAALGRCATALEPWRAALQRAGFADWRHCRIEDGGPLLARRLAG
ncbi:MAG: arginine N-succinyltransferase [Inhella sp.]